MCSFDPTKLPPEMDGVMECPECGEMVVAGEEHPEDYSLIDDDYYEEETD